jgi:MFS family permease
MLWTTPDRHRSGRSTARSTSRSTAIRALTTAHAANALGDGSFQVTSVLFFTQVVGLSVAQAGAGLSVAWGLGFLASTPIGHLADRVGLRRSAVLLSLATATALVLASRSDGPGPFLVTIAGYAVSQSALAAVRQALLVSVVPSTRRVVVRARLHAVVNAGMGAGAALGGVALLVGTPTAYRAVFLFDAATFLVSAALLTRLPAPSPRTSGAPTAGAGARRFRLDVLRDRRYLAAAGLNAVLYLYMPMLSVALPLYVAARTAAPTWAIAPVFVVNTVGVLLLQVRAARPVITLATAAKSLRRAGVVLLLSCLVFGAAATTGTPRAALLVLITGAALQVVGEVLLAAGSWHVGFALADEARPGQWQGLYSSGLQLARSVGPLLLTALLVTWSGPGWPVLGLVFALAGLALTPVVRS